MVFSKSVKDVDAAKLAGFTKLRMLGLADTKDTDALVKQLDKLPTLKVLELSRTTITDAAFAGVAKLENLEEFYAEGTKLSPQMLATLATLPKVYKVMLAKAEIDDAGFLNLAKSKSLKRLNINHTTFYLTDVPLLNVEVFSAVGSQFDNGGVQSLPQTLVEADLSGTRMSDGGLKLFKTPKLEKLNLADTHITGNALSDLESLKSLKDLTLGGKELTDAGLRRLTVLSSVKKLDVLNATAVTDAALASIAGMTGLEELAFENVPITDAGIRELAKCKTLKRATFVKTKVTKAGGAALTGVTVSFE